jgi:ABC-type molybdenum transport system ATPase subunit/photorepair protein PhrA
MRILKVPKPLRDILGDDGSEGLVEMLEQQQNQTKDATIETAGDRFERRLTEVGSELNSRITAVEARLDSRITVETAKLRVEIAGVEARLQVDIAETRTDLSTRIEKSKTETIRWMFLFYIGQVAALGGLLYALLR